MNRDPENLPPQAITQGVLPNGLSEAFIPTVVLMKGKDTLQLGGKLSNLQLFQHVKMLLRNLTM
jgi:hypothetical protein